MKYRKHTRHIHLSFHHRLKVSYIYKQLQTILDVQKLQFPTLNKNIQCSLTGQSLSGEGVGLASDTVEVKKGFHYLSVLMC